MDCNHGKLNYICILFNIYLTRKVSEEQIRIYNDGLPKGKKTPVGMGAGIKKCNIGQNTHHDKRDNTT